MILSKRLRGKWRAAFIEFEKVTGFEPLCQGRIDSGEMTIQEAWDYNIQWYIDHANRVYSIKTP